MGNTQGTHITGNGKQELQFLLLHKLAADPTGNKAQFYYNTVSDVVKVFDTAWKYIPKFTAPFTAQQLLVGNGITLQAITAPVATSFVKVNSSSIASTSQYIALSDINPSAVTTTITSPGVDTRVATEKATVTYINSLLSALTIPVVAGSKEWVQYNDGGELGADAQFKWDKLLNVLTLSRTVGESNTPTLKLRYDDNNYSNILFNDASELHLLSTYGIVIDSYASETGYLNIETPYLNITSTAINFSGGGANKYLYLDAGLNLTYVAAPSQYITSSTKGLWDVTVAGGAISVPAYTTQQTGKFDNSASVPISITTTLNYDGIFRATRLYSGNLPVMLTHGNQPTGGTLHAVATSTNAGFCPQLPSVTPTTKFLRGDGSWVQSNSTLSFDTYTQMQDYLTNAARYSGQIVSCKDVDGSIFELDITGSIWHEHKVDTSNTVAELIINNTQTLTGFGFPHGTCVAGDYIYMGSRDASVLRMVKVNSNDLSDYTIATLATSGSSIEALVYDPITNKLYSNAIDGAGAKILCIDPVDLSFTVFYSSLAFDLGASPAFNIIGDYLYVISYQDAKIYKFEIATGTLIDSVTPTSGVNGHNLCNDGTYLYSAVATNTTTIYNEPTVFYKIHKDTLAITYLTINIDGIYISMYTDDISCNVVNGITKVYLGVERQNTLVVVDGTNMTYELVYSPTSYGTFTDGVDLYSCAYGINGIVKYPNLDTANPIIVIDPLDAIVNELFFVNNKLFYATYTNPSIIREYEFPALNSLPLLGTFSKGLGAIATDYGGIAIGMGALSRGKESIAIGTGTKSNGGGTSMGRGVSVSNGAYGFGVRITNNEEGTVGYGIGTPYAQILCQDGNVAIGITTKTEAEPSCSAFTVRSANQGILIPNHDEFSKGGINGLVEGCMIFNTDTHKFEYWNGTAWDALSPYRDGFMDYNHAGSTQSYVSGDLKILNDGAGAYTLKTYKPLGISELWNTTTNQFDFSGLSVGDEVTIRTDGLVTTTANNQDFGTKINFDIGGTLYPLQLGYSEFKTTGTYPIVRNVSFYIGNTGTRDNPAELIFSSNAAATLQLNGFYISVKRRP